MPSLIPAHGERAVIVGQSGSGKTQLAKWMLWHMPGTIIYDTKTEDAFAEMGPIVESVDEAFEIFGEEGTDVDHVIVRPPGWMIAQPRELDAMLLDHYDRGEGITAYIDEAYQFHNQGRAGPGYVSLQTRGRSRGITTISSSQRPNWLSTFAFSELNHLYALRLQLDDDRKRLSDIINGYHKRDKPPLHYFDYARADGEAITRYEPIDIDYRPSRIYREKQSGTDLPARSQYFNWI